MSTFCPKTFAISVTAPVVPPIIYYKLDAVGGGGEALDSGPYALHTDINGGAYSIVPGKITNAHRWGTTGAHMRLIPDAHLDFTGSDWTLRIWVKFNALPGFYYNYPFYLQNTTNLILAAKGVGGSLPLPGSDSECRPYFAWTGGIVWSDQDTVVSRCKDLAWHRVVVRYTFGTNTPGISVDDGTEFTARTGGAMPALTTLTPRMAGPDNHGAPANCLSTCEAGAWPYRWSDAEMNTDWNSGNGVTYP